MYKRPGSLGRLGRFSLAYTNAPDPDTTPDAFSFPTTEGASAGTVYTAGAAATIQGITASTAFTVTGGQVSKNGSGGPWVTSGTVVLGDTLLPRGTAIAGAGNNQDVIVTVGGVSGTYRITTAYEAPFYDDFGTPTGTINGRTRDGKSWVTEPLTGGSNVDALQVVTAGGLSGSIGTAPLNSYGAYKPAVDPTTEQWVWERSRSFAAANWYDHITIGASITAMELLYVVSGATGAIQHRKNIAGVTGSLSTASNIKRVAEDVFMRRYFKSGGNWFVELYHNGAMVKSAYNLTTNYADLPITFKHGYRGNIPTNSAFPGGVADDYLSGDATTDGMVAIYSPSRMRLKNDNGSMTVRLNGFYNGAAPNTLSYTLYNAATNAAVTGHTDEPIQGYSASGGNWSGTTKLIASGDIPATFYIKVTRGGLAGGKSSLYFTPTQKPMTLCIGLNGQSLMQEMWTANSGASGTAIPADSWLADGSTDVGATDADRRYNPTLVDSPLALFHTTINNALGALPMCIIRGGKGGTKVVERIPGTANFTALVEGVVRAGGDLNWMIDSSGTYDSGSADRAMFVSNMDSIIDALEAQSGRTIRVILCPVGTVWNGVDSDFDALRKIQWKMCQDRPARYFLGPWTMHLQHKSGDQYHLPNTEYAEQARLMAWQFLDAYGVSNAKRTGPKLLSAARTSSNQITVTFDLNGASSLNLLNTAYLSDFKGGLRFATAGSNFASPLDPTGATVNSVVGTTQSITFTFSGTPFASVACDVSGPSGREPFNPTHDANVRADVYARASMIVGLFSGEPNVPVQPYFQVSGNDYITST